MKYVISATLIFSALTLFLFCRLDNLLITSQHVQKIELGGLQHGVKGKLILPENITSPPVLMINGAEANQPHYPSSIYTPLINALVSQGIGVFLLTHNAGKPQHLLSSFRPEGNPLTSTIAALKSLNSLANSRFGLLSFNADNAEVKTLALLSQLDYLIISVAKEDALNNNANYYDVAKMALHNLTGSKTEALFLISDREHLAVNTHESFIGFDDKHAAPHCFAVVSDATKMLLKSQWYPSSSSFERWSLSEKLHFWVQGEKAWAPDAIKSIAAWVLKGSQATCSSPG